MTGHFLDHEVDSEGNDISRQIPTMVEGRCIVRSDAQAFAKTAQILEMGMCGGPVLDESGKVAGVIEGVVPVLPEHEVASASEARRYVDGCAVFIDSVDIKKLIAEVEASLL